jgi:hypothetical protein
MKLPRLITALSLCAMCLAAGLGYVVWSRNDPCGRFARLSAKVVRLQYSRPRPYSFSDHLVGLLHRSDPLAYYEKVAAAEKKALLASGRLVEFRIPYTVEGERSDREIAKTLFAVWQRTGAGYWIDFDLTNHLMLVACRPRDVRQFQILK